MKKLFFPYLYCTCLLLAAGCAQMAEPTGGDKDTRAPEIITERTVPHNNSVHFTGSGIVIGFNEYITVKSQQVVITPALSKKPVIKAKGKKLEINFQEPLAPNTTYTVNLSGAITDITEGNATQNLQYVFSTGPYLDSLGISGQVTNAFTGAGVSATTVILHPAGNDSLVLKSKPAYFIKTASDGTFSFYHLKQGRYRIYAINDQNTDLLFSQYPEDVAFMDSIIVLDSNVSKIALRQFKPVEKKTYMTRSANISRYVQLFAFNKMVKDLQAVPLKSSDSTLKFYAAHAADSVFYMSLHDTLRTDTIRFAVRSGNQVLDTLDFTAHLSRKTSGRAGFKLKYGPETYLGDSIFLYSITGCRLDPSRITATDTLHKKPLPFSAREVFNGCSIFPAGVTERIPLRLVCLPGAFTSPITGETNDTLVAITTLMPPDKTGNVKLTVKGLEQKNVQHPVCVLMLDKTRIAKFYLDPAQPVITVNGLKPGNYSFYLFDDADGDGEWSTGDFNSKTQPERILRFNQPVKVKANWDQDLTWVL